MRLVTYVARVRLRRRARTRALIYGALALCAHGDAPWQYPLDLGQAMGVPFGRLYEALASLESDGLIVSLKDPTTGRRAYAAALAEAGLS